jgi:hypothetical protein
VDEFLGLDSSSNGLRSSTGLSNSRGGAITSAAIRPELLGNPYQHGDGRNNQYSLS